MNKYRQLKIKVIPKSSENRIIGWEGEVLKIKVTAPPEKGKANEAVIRLLSKALRLAKSKFSVTSGLHSRKKTICIEGATDEDIQNLA